MDPFGYHTDRQRTDRHLRGDGVPGGIAPVLEQSPAGDASDSACPVVRWRGLVEPIRRAGQFGGLGASRYFAVRQGRRKRPAADPRRRLCLCTRLVRLPAALHRSFVGRLLPKSQAVRPWPPFQPALRRVRSVRYLLRAVYQGIWQTLLLDLRFRQVLRLHYYILRLRGAGDLHDGGPGLRLQAGLRQVSSRTSRVARLRGSLVVRFVRVAVELRLHDGSSVADAGPVGKASRDWAAEAAARGSDSVFAAAAELTPLSSGAARH